MMKLAIDHFKDFYMSTKRLEQAAQATKTHLYSQVKARKK
jgi:[acyl-carrier-protein] S-malonyltransferase